MSRKHEERSAEGWRGLAHVCVTSPILYSITLAFGTAFGNDDATIGATVCLRFLWESLHVKYTTEQLDAIAAKLQKMPAVEKKQEHNKQEAVKILKKEIVALQKRGYTLDQISEALRGEGFEISTPTLKSYLQRTKRARKSVAKATGAGGSTPAKSGATAVALQEVPQGAAFTPRTDTDDI